MSALREALASEGAFAPNATRSGASANERRLRVRWACAGLLAAALFGAALGSYGWKLRGSLYSCVKVPLLLVASTALVVPFAYVLHAASGQSAVFGAALRGMLAAQGTLAVTLAALAPATLLFQASGLEYGSILCVNAAAFALALLPALVTFRRHYAAIVLLTAQRAAQQRALAIWFGLYVFVAIKLGWLLRPFIGDPRLSTTFLRPRAFDENPYVLLLWTVVGAFRQLAISP